MNFNLVKIWWKLHVIDFTIFSEVSVIHTQPVSPICLNGIHNLVKHSLSLLKLSNQTNKNILDGIKKGKEPQEEQQEKDPSFKQDTSKTTIAKWE